MLLHYVLFGGKIAHGLKLTPHSLLCGYKGRCFEYYPNALADIHIYCGNFGHISTSLSVAVANEGAGYKT